LQICDIPINGHRLRWEIKTVLMKILMIHNKYAARSGEEVQFDAIAQLLAERGHEVSLYTKSSEGITHSASGKIAAFLGGVWNPRSRHDMRRLLGEKSPDIVFVQNLYPLISPSILSLCREEGIPIVMRVANYRLMCPNGLHLSHGRVCERCIGGKEYWCLLMNCEGNIFKSAGYSLRNAVARSMGLYKENVTEYISASSFLRNRMVEAGFPVERIHTIPNVVPDVERTSITGEHNYVAYVGRISREKGVDILIAAAEKCPEIPFRLAGKLNPLFRLPSSFPKNIEFTGFLEKEALSKFYAEARFVVSCSECFETFGMSVAEAMLHEKPVIASRIGIFPEFVQEGITGMLAETGNADDLARKIWELWKQPDLCRAMGKAGRQRALSEYSPDIYYTRIMDVFMKAIQQRYAV